MLVEIVVGQSLFGSVDVRIFEFDAFFANDLRAAAKEDACEVWFESSNFKDAAWLGIDKFGGTGVSHDRRLEMWPFIEGILLPGAEPLAKDVKEGEEVICCSFGELTDVGNPEIERRD